MPAPEAEYKHPGAFTCFPGRAAQGRFPCRGGRTVPTTFGPAKGRWAERKRARGFPPALFRNNVSPESWPCAPFSLAIVTNVASIPRPTYRWNRSRLLFLLLLEKGFANNSVPFTASYFFFRFDRDKVLFKIPLWAISTPQLKKYFVFVCGLRPSSECHPVGALEIQNSRKKV